MGSRIAGGGIAAVDRIWALGDHGPYQLEAAIAAIHGRAANIGATDWVQIVGLYLLLGQHTPTAPVRLGRVVAAAHAFGPAVGLQLLEQLDADFGISEDPLTRQRAHAVRAHLLEQRLDYAGSASHFRAAAELTANQVERAFLLTRAEQAESR